MTPDEQVRRVHTLEGAARFLGTEQESLKARLAVIEGRLGLLERRQAMLLSQQNQLLAAIRGLEVGSAQG